MMNVFEAFKTIPNGEIFRVVTTKYHSVDRIKGEFPELTFVCKKGYGYDDWCIYYHYPEKGIEWISEHGDKVMSDVNILSIFPCDTETLSKYRH